MADVAETRDDSPVGAQHAVPAVGRPPVGRRPETQDDTRRGTGPRPTEEPQMEFDAAKLHSQLAELLQLYLARASQPDAIAKCSAKDAISCAKTLTGMMSDVQSGKPKSWSGDLQVATPSTPAHHSLWRRRVARPGGRASVPLDGGTGACPPQLQRRRVPPVIRHNTPARRRCHQESSPGYRPLATGYSPILDDALSVVCASDEETTIPEPHKRLIARIQKLCTEVQKQLDAASSPARSSPNRVRGAHQRRSENEGCEKDIKSRASESPTHHSRYGDGAPGLPKMDPPVGARHAVPSDAGDETPAVINDRPTDDSPVTSPTPNPSPLTPSPPLTGGSTHHSFSDGGPGGDLADGSADSSLPTSDVLPPTAPPPKNSPQNTHCDNMRPNTPYSASARKTIKNDGTRSADLAEGGARRPRPTDAPPSSNQRPATNNRGAPKARKKRRRSLYTLGASLRHGNHPARAGRYPSEGTACRAPTGSSLATGYWPQATRSAPASPT